MIIDNELLNQLIRKGDGYKTFSACPRIDAIVDADGSLHNDSNSVPLLDAIRALIYAAQSLRPSQIHPVNLASVTLERDALEALIITIIRQIPIQDDIFSPTPSDPKVLVDLEVGVAKNAYDVAAGILKDVATHTVNKTVFLFDDYHKTLSTSALASLTQDLLADARPNHPAWVTSGESLPALTTVMPEALPAKDNVTINCKITDLNSKSGIAKIEIIKCVDSYSENALSHRLSDVELYFDTQTIELDDLRLIYYRDQPIEISASAFCATHKKYARKTVLRLQEIKLNRTSMDGMHKAARQLKFDF